MRPPSFFIHPKHSNIPPLCALFCYSLPIFPISFPMPLKSASVPRSPRSPGSPYPSSASRRTSSSSSSQPKSSRQQFSACGACRMRRWGFCYCTSVAVACSTECWGNRVRCDLKDLPFSSTGTQPQCSNCKERGLKCVLVFSNLSIRSLS